MELVAGCECKVCHSVGQGPVFRDPALSRRYNEAETRDLVVAQLSLGPRHTDPISIRRICKKLRTRTQIVRSACNALQSSRSAWRIQRLRYRLIPSTNCHRRSPIIAIVSLCALITGLYKRTRDRTLRSLLCPSINASPDTSRSRYWSPSPNSHFLRSQLNVMP